MEMAHEERRGSPRARVSGVRVQLPVSGKVLDASIDGIAIETTEGLRRGWSYAFKMAVGAKIVSVPGKVSWCRLVGTQETENGDVRPVFRLGVALVGSIWSKRQIYAYP